LSEGKKCASAATLAQLDFMRLLKGKIERQNLLAAASLTLMPSPTDPSERIAEVLREILFLTTDMSSPAASETKKEKDPKVTASEQEQEPKS
jgi:hypothetical protein